MGQIMIMVGSHTINKSVSYYLADWIQRIFKDKGVCDISLITINDNSKKNTIRQIFKSIALILIAPIYIDSPPSKILKWMAEIEKSSEKNAGNNKLKYFAVISNCGFYEAEHNKLAIMIYHCFAEKIGVEYICGVGIGCGQLITNAKVIYNCEQIINKPIVEVLNIFVQNILNKLQNSINNLKDSEIKDIYLNFKISRNEYENLTNRYWLSLGSVNGLNKKDYFNCSFNNTNEEYLL